MKVKLITHISDPDGLFPVVLANQVFEQLEYDLLGVDEVDDKVKEVLLNIDTYDQVYITDLNISRSLAEIIEQNELYRSKIKIIDHHIGKIDMNDFSFIDVVSEKNGIQQSATSLFYEYLKAQYPVLEKPCIRTLVEYIRKVDTWTWQGDLEAKNIDILLDLYGEEYFIEYLTQYVKTHDIFQYDEKERVLFQVVQKKMDRYIEEMKESMFFAEIDTTKVGICFCDRYISDVGNALCNDYQDKIDFIILIKLSKGRCSYRAEKSEVNVLPTAQKHNGNGHNHAAGSPIEIDIQKKIIQMLYPEVKNIVENEEKKL